jgi:hypothetical protein
MSAHWHRLSAAGMQRVVALAEPVTLDRQTTKSWPQRLVQKSCTPRRIDSELQESSRQLTAGRAHDHPPLSAPRRRQLGPLLRDWEGPREGHCVLN